MQTLLERPDLSVIVPVYNLERFMDPLLTCLKRQDLGGYSLEYIFVLNNCTDRSEDVIRASGLPCKIIECTEQGCGPARNAGFEESTGARIWFMDGDDWLLGEKVIRDALDGAQGLDIYRVPYTSNMFLYDYFAMVWQYVFRREFVEEFRFRKEQPGEDDDYMMRVLAKAGFSRENFTELPSLRYKGYYYYYLRAGSNMERWTRGEDLNH